MLVEGMGVVAPEVTVVDVTAGAVLAATAGGANCRTESVSGLAWDTGMGGPMTTSEEASEEAEDCSTLTGAGAATGATALLLRLVLCRPAWARA